MRLQNSLVNNSQLPEHYSVHSMSEEDLTNLPYGAGSVIFNRRNRIHPWEARRYNGRNINGNPLYIHIGSYATRREAYMALWEAYQFSNEDIQNEELTFESVFEAFLNDYVDEYSRQTIKAYQISFRKCAALHNKRYKDITVGQMRAVAKQIPSSTMRSNVQRLFRAMDREARMLGMDIRGEAQFLSQVRQTESDIANRKIREPFTDEEVFTLLEHEDDHWMFIPLILLYTGLRQGELRQIKKENVDLGKCFFTGGIKTDSGRERRIPIHPAIRKFFIKLMQTEGEYLLNVEGKTGNRMMRDDELRNHFNEAIAPYVSKMHIPHETRHTFISKLMEMGVKDNIIRKLVGHKLPEATDRFYYHVKDQQLMDAVMLLWEKPSGITD